MLFLFLARLDEVQEELLYYPGVGIGVGGGVSKNFNVKVFYVMGKALSGELSCPCDRSYYLYSRLSLSRLRLSRITDYLEEKIWSLFKHGNLTSANKILWIRGEIAHQEQFLPFPTIFSIYISN